jgi:uncharacterized membrane protein YkvA (DUF1232 family)/tellurite resistance protein
MFKGKIKKQHRELLLELLKLMAEMDGKVSTEEMEMILKIKKVYGLKNYTYKNLTKDDIRQELSELEEETVLNILTHAVLLALVDKEFSLSEQVLIRSYFDLLSLDSASKMQGFIDKYGKEEFDVRDFFISNRTDQDILDESIDMLNDFSNGNIDDIDESLLMKMKRGPIKKIWDQVIKLWDIVRDPKTDKAIKALGIGALLYLISPLDVIPDAIPILGLTDDVGVITYVLTQLSKQRKLK